MARDLDGERERQSGQPREPSPSAFHTPSTPVDDGFVVRNRERDFHVPPESVGGGASAVVVGGAQGVCEVVEERDLGALVEERTCSNKKLFCFYKYWQN